MKSREDVINGLEFLYKTIRTATTTTFICASEKALCLLYIENAIELLKAQEPRVITLEEITDLKYHDMVYVEFKHPRKEEYRTLGGFVDQMYKDIDTTEIKAIDITVGVIEIAHCQMKLYLNDFRLWTSRPTKEQMEAIPWN